MIKIELEVKQVAPPQDVLLLLLLPVLEAPHVRKGQGEAPDEAKVDGVGRVEGDGRGGQLWPGPKKAV